MPERGSIVTVNLNPTVGHEQQGFRPCIVVSDPRQQVHQRFPMVCVIPVTSFLSQGPLYPRLSPGTSGLRLPSCALIDQIRAVDAGRIRDVIGRLSTAEFSGIESGLRVFLGLDAGR